MIDRPSGTPPLIAPSLLSCDFARLGEEIDALQRAGADLLHLDVMDGRFVPNITVGPIIVSAARRVSSLPLDVHLMIVEPERYIADFAKAGADLLTVHWEASTHLHRTLQAIRGLGVRAGVSINPATPATVLEHVLGEADVVLVMSVNPGFGGQDFIPSALEKITRVDSMRRAGGHERLLIEVDGGVTHANAAPLIACGADILVSGNAVFSSGDYASYIRGLRQPA
jgi:ribulose-phosphate 3-epimerase